MDMERFSQLEARVNQVISRLERASTDGGRIHQCVEEITILQQQLYLTKKVDGGSINGHAYGLDELEEVICQAETIMNILGDRIYGISRNGNRYYPDSTTKMVRYGNL